MNGKIMQLTNLPSFPHAFSKAEMQSNQFANLVVTLLCFNQTLSLHHREIGSHFASHHRGK